jgi:hypothetical protein
MDRFYDTSKARLRELWNVLSDRDRQDLQKAVSGILVTRRTLRLQVLAITV